MAFPKQQQIPAPKLNVATTPSTSTPRCEAINKMERTDACAGYRNTHYRNGGYDSAKNSDGSLHFVANARVSPRQWNETLCLCMAINPNSEGSQRRSSL